jgi:hypothetical protein
MKFPRLALALLGVFGLLAFTACKPPSEQGTASPGPSSASRGTLRLNVSFIGNCTSLRITVRDSANAVVATRTITDFTDFWTAPVSLDVPAGTLSAQAEVLVAAISATNPVMSGSVSGVSVGASGSTDAEISCLPVSPIALAEGSSSSSYPMVSTQFNASTNVEDGSELWFAISPLSSGVRIATTITNSLSSQSISAYMIDTAGNYIGYPVTINDGASADLCVVPGRTNYLCITRSINNADVAVSLATFSAVRVTGAAFSMDTFNLIAGVPSYSLSPVFSPGNAFNQLYSYSSSNPAVVAVDSFGGLTGLVIGGTATITLITVDGGFTDSCAVTVIGTPYAGWTTTSLAGSSNSGTAASVSLERWYSGTIAAPPSGWLVESWYSVPVTAGHSYDIYFDTGDADGSGAYTGTLILEAFHANGSTQYNDTFGNYAGPMTVIPAESTLLICVRSFQPAGYGTYAFGVHAQ